MEASWLLQLQQLNIMPEIIELLEKDKVVNAAAFSSYLDSRAEVTTVILDRVPNASSRRDQKIALTQLWRGADAEESLRIQRKTGGISNDDLEDPLPDGSTEQFRSRFLQLYNFNLSMKETLCEPLMAMLKREIDRRSHSMIPLERVRTARETSVLWRPVP